MGVGVEGWMGVRVDGGRNGWVEELEVVAASKCRIHENREGLRWCGILRN
jgi:hypothetical protein